MLDSGLKQQVQTLFEGLHSSYTFRVEVANNHEKRNELIEMLQEVASCSDKIDVEVGEGQDLSFTLVKDGQPTSIVFKAIPSGHEFSTLLLAILNLDGKGRNFPDEIITDRIKRLQGKHLVRSFISLSCTNCPDVVQELNMIAILNPDIRHEIIDGGLYEDEVKSLNIQAVPTVYVDDKMLNVGKSSLGELLQKLEQHCGMAAESTMEMVEKEYDVVVAGGGPAGVTAAIYAVRKGMSVALIAEKVGGQVLETSDIENLTSVAHTTGKELGKDLRTHLSGYPVDVFEQRKITEVSRQDSRNKILTSLGERFSSRALIVATGASWRRLNVKGEAEYIGSGVAFCTHCDGPFYKGKKVVVIGGGNSGIEAAIDLAGIATEVTVLEFMPEFRADQVLLDKLSEFSNVTTHTMAETLEVIGDGKKVTALRYRDRESGEEHLVQTDGIFVQIGLAANSKPFDSLVEVNRAGEIPVDIYCRTNVTGIYAAGDVTTVPYKQIVIAMGEGAKAALSLFQDSIKNVI